MSRWPHLLSSVCLAIACFVVATPADAGETDQLTGEDRPDTWDMSLDELKAVGLGQYRGDPIPVPPGMPRLRAPDEPPVHAQQGVIFVNFDGANLSSGSDNSQTDTTQIGQLAGNFSPYGDGAKRDATMQAVATDWAAYNVIVTDSRPANGNYTMNMTGPTNPFGGGVLGIAPLDCNDSQTPNNITYAFHSAGDQFSASTQATTIGQEVAHSFGLEHVDEPGDIMNPFNAGGDPSFRDQCIQIVQGVVCGSQHNAQCGSSNMQNSHAELMELFGPSTPDTQLPVVTISFPEDGAEFEPLSDFEIFVTANDDVGIQDLKLFSNGEHIQSDVDEPYGWDVNDIPEGTYEFYVEATDLAGNSGMSNVVTVYVGTDAPPPEGDGDSEGDSGDGDGDDGDGDDGDDSDSAGDGAPLDDGGSLPGGFGAGRGEQACACTTDVGLGAKRSAWLLALAIFGLVRRRRR